MGTSRMKKRTIRILFSLFSILLFLQGTIAEAAKPDFLKIGEVLNKQPFADFNMIKSKPVDVVLNAGHYNTDVATLQSKMNSIVKTKLDQHGIPSNIMVKPGTTNIAGKLYADAQTAITPLSGKVYYWGYSSHLAPYSYTTTEYDANCDCYYYVTHTETVPMRDSGFWTLPIDGTQVLKVLRTGNSYAAKYYDNQRYGCYCYRDTTIPYIYFIMKNGSVLRWAGFEGFVDVTNNTFQSSTYRGPYSSIRWGDITDYHHYGYFDYIIKRDGTVYMSNYIGSSTTYSWPAPSAGGTFVQIPVTGKAVKMQMDGYYGCCQTVQILTDQNQTWNIAQDTDYYQNTGVFTVKLTQALTGVKDVWMSSQTGALSLLSNGLFNWSNTTTSTPVLGQPTVPQQAAGGYIVSSWGCSCQKDISTAYNIDASSNLNVTTWEYYYGLSVNTRLITNNIVAVDWSGYPDYAAYSSSYSPNPSAWVTTVKNDGSIYAFQPVSMYSGLSTAAGTFANYYVNDMYVKNVQIELQDQIQAQDVTSFWQAGRDHYFVDLADIARNELNDGPKSNAVLKTLLNTKIRFVGLSNSTNQSQYQNLINQNDGLGTTIDNSSLDTALNNLADYIIQQYDNSSVMSQYVLLGDTVNYTPHYTDLENDPMYATRWKYTQDPSVFDNSLGMIPDSGQYRSSSYSTFTLPGKYTINFSAQDNPKNDNRFANYRLWSLDSSSQMIIYAHRKPIADFTVNFRSRAANGYYNTDITDVSYDPDHSISQADKGIVNRIWQWKPISQTSWNSGSPPTSFAPNSEYLFYLKVQDAEGAWSDPKVVDVQTYNVNFAPSMVITNPTGTQTSPTVVNAEPNITWNYTDPENDPQEKWTLDYYYSDGSLAHHAEGTGTQTNYQTPSGILSYGKTIKVVGKVFSKNQWSLPSNSVYFFLNRPPSVNITYPPSSDPNNPDFVTQNFIVTWDYTDPESQPQQAFQVTILDYASGATLASSGVVNSGSHSWKVNTTLPQNKLLYVVVKASDGYAWSAQSAPKYFKLNRPPKAGFTVFPSPPYEGDQVTITGTASDPDGDPLTYNYVITKPDGTCVGYTTANPSFKVDQLGQWTVTQTVTDTGGLSDSLTQNFTVMQLTVQGQVQHTPEWEQNRQLYNSNTNFNRPVTMFWAGEKFELVADTSVITGNSPTIANSVTVDVPLNFVDGYPRTESVTLTPDSTHRKWTGELWQDDFEKIPNGTYQFTFTATWSNGTLKTNTVQIEIQDSVFDYYQLHRRF
jgi:hypothetical protein